MRAAQLFSVQTPLRHPFDVFYSGADSLGISAIILLLLSGQTLSIDSGSVGSGVLALA